MPRAGDRARTRVRACRRQPREVHLHQGDAARARSPRDCERGRPGGLERLITAIFFVAALVALAGAVGIVVFRNPIASVLSLVLVMLALSVIFLLLSAQFLFAVQIIVYAGAVMVLFLFVIALLGPVRELATTRLPRQGLWAVILAAGFATLLVSLLGNLRYHAPAATNLDAFGTV